MALSLTAIQEKNKLGTDSVFAILLEVLIPANDPVYVTNNSETIHWRNVDWIPFKFDISEINESSSGEVPQWSITFDNTNRIIEKYLNDYDNYLKNYGIENNQIKCNCYIVNTKDLDNTDPIKDVYFELSQPETNSIEARFTLTADSMFNMQSPKRRYIKQFCYWKFKGIECGYTGSQIECDKSLTRCKQLNNSSRFGGFPAVGTGGIKL